MGKQVFWVSDKGTCLDLLNSCQHAQRYLHQYMNGVLDDRRFRSFISSHIQARLDRPELKDYKDCMFNHPQLLGVTT